MDEAGRRWRKPGGSSFGIRIVVSDQDAVKHRCSGLGVSPAELRRLAGRR